MNVLVHEEIIRDYLRQLCEAAHHRGIVGRGKTDDECSDVVVVDPANLHHQHPAFIDSAATRAPASYAREQLNVERTRLCDPRSPAISVVP
jgi:hypothetical protein